MSNSKSAPLEDLHPALWRASQLGRSAGRCVDTGHLALSNQLAGGGWPTGSVIELMVQQAGVGELRLLAPALAQVARRKVVLIHPPHAPNSLALAGLGVAPADVIWLKGKASNDLLWAAEQVLKNASYGAVLLWMKQIRTESLRRLNLAAQAGETLLYVVRPLSAAQDASPSPLRLSLRPALHGIEVTFVKRRGPQTDKPLFLPLTVPGMPVRSPEVPVPARQEPVIQLMREHAAS